MDTFWVRNMKFGQGMPKICIPLTGAGRTELMEEASLLRSSGGDMAEWRADYYEHGKDVGSVTAMLSEIRALTGERPLLFTFRSAAEGGARDLPEDLYVAWNRAVMESGNADLVDLELRRDPGRLKELIQEARRTGVKAVLSHHDFEGTPSKGEMLEIFREMQDLGAHMTKLAVMAKGPEDVLRLLEVSRIMKEEAAKVPFIAISMGEKGMISRIAGGLSGSAVTFGAGMNLSAPGQIPAKDLRRIMRILDGGEGNFPGRIFLIGFMGSGKTSSGKWLSQKLGYSFADMDSMIEEREGLPIRTIFAEKGESYFRDIESRMLLELSARSRLVVSCGGGIAEREENIQILSGSGVTVFLRDDPRVLYSRVSQDANRPLAGGGAPREAGRKERFQGFETLYLSRLPRYERAASLSVDGTGKTPEQIADEIMELLK